MSAEEKQRKLIPTTSLECLDIRHPTLKRKTPLFLELPGGEKYTLNQGEQEKVEDTVDFLGNCSKKLL